MSSSSLPQPLVAYPRSTSTHPPSHSKGSFGPVFVVLAVITVVAIIACVISRLCACVISRLCARRLCQPKNSPVGRAHAVRDMEHGFGDFPEAKSPTAKPAAEKAGTAGTVRDGQLKGGNSSKMHQEIRGDEKPHGANFEVKPSK